MTKGKTIVLTMQTFINKVMSLLFDILSRLVITFLSKSSVQSLSCVRLFVTPWIAPRQASLSITNSRSSPKLMCIELVMSDSCESSRWCRPVISSSVIPFSSYPQSLLPSGSFPMSQLFARGGQSIGGSASASVLPVNIQDWSPLGWTYTPIKSKKFEKVKNK